MATYDDVKYKCNQCDKTYTNKWSLNRHIKFHDNTEQSTCKRCNKILSSIENFNYHMKYVHMGKDNIAEEPQIIVFNGMYRTFGDIPSIRIATWDNEGSKNSPCKETSKCEICNKSYSNASNLNKHMRKNHEQN